MNCKTIAPVAGFLFFGYVTPHVPWPMAPEKCAGTDTAHEDGQNVRILFWNTENLYDFRDDSLTADEEFTPGGAKRWSYARFQTKLQHTAKVILAAGDRNPPGIIGLCEIENRYVLNKLIYESPLKSYGYRIIHRDSPDSRGSDVALLYHPDQFFPLYREWIGIRFPFDTISHTRDILYVKGILMGADTIHLFVNHWPSRRGGEEQSASRRNYVAQRLREKVDSVLISPYLVSGVGEPSVLQSAIPFPCILIMGDFNDEPENESLHSILQARYVSEGNHPGGLINLMSGRQVEEGSHKFGSEWSFLDQFIVSGALLNQQNTIYIDSGSARIFCPDFLLEDDLKYLGKKPRRTYLGPRYQGGFSDHLPILVDIIVNGKK